MDGQEILDRLELAKAEEALEAEWSDPLSDPKLTEKISDISERIKNLMTEDNKENLLEILRPSPQKRMNVKHKMPPLTPTTNYFLYKPFFYFVIIK